MNRRARVYLGALLLICGAVLLTLSGCGGGSSTSSGNGGGGGGGNPPPTAADKIKHVVIIFQENRTPDNLFQDPVLYDPPPAGHGADIVQSGLNTAGQHLLRRLGLSFRA